MFSECAVALYAEGLIELASVEAAPAAGWTFAAVGIRGYGDGGSGLELPWDIWAEFQNGCGDFVAGDARVGDERILAAETIEVGTAEADHGYA